MGELSPLEKILKTPGLVHLAEKIFDNLEYKPYNPKYAWPRACYDLNQSSRRILDDPKFWLRRFGQLSKENQKDWINVIQLENRFVIKTPFCFMRKRHQVQIIPFYCNTF